MVHVFCANRFSKETFTFTFSAGPLLNFSFAKPVVTVAIDRRKTLKRRRALSDVDGDGNEGRKKRRLRLQLITSRLSRPFSQPATNIAASSVRNGTSKISIWGTKTKGPQGRSALRKCAVMNRVRMKMDAAKEFMREEQEKRNLSLRNILCQKPTLRMEQSLPPSPLGLSNYDAFDLENEAAGFEDDDEENGWNRYQEDEDDGEKDGFVCDFNILNPVGMGNGEDYELLDALDGIDGISKDDLPEEPPTPPPEERIVEMLREDQRSDEGVVHAGLQNN